MNRNELPVVQMDLRERQKKASMEMKKHMVPSHCLSKAGKE
jgi:hypothetical protein